MHFLDNAAKPILNLLRARPVLAIFEICLRCNSACGYCDLPLNVGRYEMSREEIRRVFGDLYTDGLRFVFVQGGEPLLRKDLPEILDDLTEIGFGLTLITNGTRLTPELISRLSRLPVNISVSLDTLDRQRYRTIRGKDQVQSVLSGIELLADFPHPKYVTCIVSEVNRDDVLEVIRFARARGFIPVVGAYHWEVGRYGKAELALQYQRQTIAKVFQEVLDSGFVPRGYLRHYVRETIRWLSGDSLEPCDAGRYNIAIDASGNVAPCLALSQAGNLLQSSLSEILGKFDTATIRQCSEHSSCNMLCSRVVGSALRHPVAALVTPTKVRPMTTERGGV